MLEKGQPFGRYVVEERIGAGGMGEVYQAHDTLLHRRVALKLLPEEQGDAAQREEARARMLREARAAAALQHPNAVAIYDLGTVGDTPYIAMELVPGESLRAYVGNRDVPWQRKLRWMLDVAGALSAAHAAGLVHRDVKPENILVKPDGHVKVLDFGIARRSSTPAGGGDATMPAGSGAAASITGAGIVLGTPKYMPPEQIAGRELDGRADQFAWGVTVYELLAGTAPWPEKTDALAAAAAILTETPPPLLSVAPELPLAVAQAVDRALSKDPRDRWATMDDLVAELDSYAAPVVPVAAASNPALSARPSGSGRAHIDPFAQTQARAETSKGVAADRAAPTSRSARRSPWALPAAAAGGAIVVALGGLLAWPRMHPAPPAPASAASAPAAASALPLTDLPLPKSADPAALALYVAALQSWHDANADLAKNELLQALAKDPALGAAHLRYARYAFFPSVDGPRKHFAQAVQLRSTLSEYDRALLDAVEPVFDRQPPDWQQAERHLEEATRKLPGDAELFETLAWVRSQNADLPGTIAAADAALKLDPSDTRAVHEKAVAAFSASDWHEAQRDADRCLELTPQASACVRLRLYGEAREGRCADYEADARRIIAIDPDSSEGYGRLAAASLALGRPVDAVHEALSASWKRLTGDDREWNIANDTFNLASALGDARMQDDGLRRMDLFARDRTETLYHMIPAWGRVLVWTEAGQLDRAADVAADYLRRSEAWTKDAGIDGFSVSFDMRPFMSKALLRAGRISRAEFEARRQAWLGDWKKRLSPVVARFLWIYGYANVTDTPEEAAEALAALPAYQPVPEFRPSLLADATVGRTLMLGGRLDEAIPVLRSAADTCDVFENAVDMVRASAWLGQALEAKGDTAGACDAYARVVARWGRLGARSTSAALAKKRMAALSCGSP